MPWRSRSNKGNACKRHSRFPPFPLTAVLLIALGGPGIATPALAQQPDLSSNAESGNAESEDQSEQPANESTVAALLDDNSTKDLHDDTTILRNVVALDDDALVLFDTFRLWIGGAAQYDYYNFDGIYNHQDDGDRDEGSNIRRLERGRILV